MVIDNRMAARGPYRYRIPHSRRPYGAAAAAEVVEESALADRGHWSLCHCGDPFRHACLETFPRCVAAERSRLVMARAQRALTRGDTRGHQAPKLVGCRLRGGGTACARGD